MIAKKFQIIKFLLVLFLTVSQVYAASVATMPSIEHNHPKTFPKRLDNTDSILTAKLYTKMEPKGILLIVAEEDDYVLDAIETLLKDREEFSVKIQDDTREIISSFLVVRISPKDKKIDKKFLSETYPHFYFIDSNEDVYLDAKAEEYTQFRRFIKSGKDKYEEEYKFKECPYCEKVLISNFVQEKRVICNSTSIIKKYGWEYSEEQRAFIEKSHNRVIPSHNCI